MKKIFISEPSFDLKDEKILSDCIKKGFATFGNNIQKFENKILRYTNSQYCLICVNGTSALQIALKVLGLKAGEEVLAPSMTFVATINAILYNNAIPIFMDCVDDLNIDTKKVINFLKTQTYISNGKTFNKKTKKRIRAIIVAHMYGNLANIADLTNICKKMKIKILEDAAESLGSFYKTGQHSGTVGDIGCFSFNGNKIITSGGGGALVSNNNNYIKYARKLINQSRLTSIEYLHSELGYNFRISNLHAALGYSQLKKIKKFLKIKKQIYKEYKDGLELSKNFELIKNNEISYSNNWINIVKIRNSKIKKKEIFERFKKYNIELRPIWYPINDQKYYKNFQSFQVNNARVMHKRLFCLPSSINLKKKDILKILKLLKKYEN